MDDSDFSRGYGFSGAVQRFFAPISPQSAQNGTNVRKKKAAPAEAGAAWKAP
jgi:hypothetical protein